MHTEANVYWSALEFPQTFSATVDSQAVEAAAIKSDSAVKTRRKSEIICSNQEYVY
jgi:hypothetical protein